MRTERIPRPAVLVGAAALLTWFALPAAPGASASGADTTAQQVIVCYFHRTVRCPTCKLVGDYVHEAVQTGFPTQVENGSVRVMTVDFQDPKNQPYVKAYKVEGPLLVILDVRDGRLVAWKPVPKVWSLLAKKAELFDYVQSEVRGYLDAQSAADR